MSNQSNCNESRLKYNYSSSNDYTSNGEIIKSPKDFYRKKDKNISSHKSLSSSKSYTPSGEKNYSTYGFSSSTNYNSSGEKA